jgi:hypothetical protein
MTIKRQMLPRDLAVKRPLLALTGRQTGRLTRPLSGTKQTFTFAKLMSATDPKGKDQTLRAAIRVV